MIEYCFIIFYCELMNICFLFHFLTTTTTTTVVYRYRPTVSISVVQTELGFSNLDDCLQFLKDKGAVVSQDSSILDCKSSSNISSS